MLNLYRRLLALRRQYPALHAGEITEVTAEGSLLRFRRTGTTQKFQVLLNLGAEPVGTHCDAGTVLLTTLLDGEGAEAEGMLTVEGGEGLLIALR